MQQEARRVSHGTVGVSWNLFARRFAPLFSFSFLGLAAVRVWLQCCVYDLYAATDSGMATVAVNLARGAVTVLLMALFMRRPFSKRAQDRLGVACAMAMTAASVLLLAASEASLPWLGWLACLLAALGVVWGGGMWMAFFERLDPEESFLCAFASLALSCLAGLVLGLFPKALTMLVATFMPALSLVTFRASMQRLDERGDLQSGASHSDPAATDKASFAPNDSLRYISAEVGRARPYDSEPPATFIRLLSGVALFSLALGFARGFPYGQAVELSAPVRALHQLGTCALCAGVVWWVLVRGRRVRLSLLWNLPLALLVVGVLLLACLTSQLMQAGSALVTVANTFTLAVLWYASYDVARNSSAPPYLVLGTVWVAHQVPREIGRLVAMGVGPYDSSPMLLAVCMVALLAGSMFLLVNDTIPHARPLFADLGGAGVSHGTQTAADRYGDNEASDRIEHAVQQGAAENAGPHLAPGTPGESTESDKSDVGNAETRLLLLGQRYELTRREVDIARLLVQDRSKAQIAEALCLSESTVRTHARNLYTKLDVHSREQLKSLVEEFADVR